MRTWFGDDQAWDALLTAVTTPTPDDGFLSMATPVDDRAWEGLDGPAMVERTPANSAIVSFIADERAQLDAGQPLLVVRVLPAPQGDKRDFPPFRVIASQLWAVENNLNLANMDWDEFVMGCDADGVFRGWPA